jgi:DNA-binding transcriptional regulator GbsR (MarR family)
MAPETIDIEFSKFAGELAESLSFNKSIGQIYGLLYVSPESLSLDDISKRLSMSKGNASINLRVLESWGAVQSVWVSGSRRDYYEANMNIKQLALKRLTEGFARRIDHAEEAISKLLAKMESGEGQAGEKKSLERIKEVHSMMLEGRKMLGMLPKILTFLGH